MRTQFLVSGWLSAACVLSASGALAGGSCQTPNDCSDNNPCTVDQCTNGMCANPPVPDGTGCNAPNPCIIGETCSSGFCVGTWALNCCTSPADCNDHNPCTTDSCQANACVHGNAPPGTPCGSSVDDACTDPDTCDAAGQCLLNDAADGGDCGGPDCLAGQCGAAKYRAQRLSEGSYIGSESLGLCFIEGDPNRPLVVGRVIDAAEVSHAAYWPIGPIPEEPAPELFVLPGTPPSTANDAVCHQPGTCIVVGWSGSPRQPAGWEYDTNLGVFVFESLPIPATYTGGAVLSYRKDIYIELQNEAGVSVIGYAADPQGHRKPVFWERNGPGDWSVFQLPDFGIPGRESLATSIAYCPEGAPAALCTPGERVMGGWAEDGPGVRRPVLWWEDGVASRTFQMSVQPLPEGATQAYDDGDTGVHEVGHWLGFMSHSDGSIFLSDMGTVALTSGRTVCTISKSMDRGSTWLAQLVVQTSPDASCVAGSLLSNPLGLNAPDVDFFMTRVQGLPGTAFFENGTATRATINVDTMTASSGPTDMNPLISGLPAGCIAGALYDNRIEPASKTAQRFSLWFRCPGSAAAGTSHPHAGIAVAIGPAGIPAVSTWGLMVSALLLLVSGTVLAMRGRRLVLAA